MNMNIISMAYTTPAWVNQAKTITRRNWNPNYASRFRKDQILRAYSSSPLGGGVPLGEMRLTDVPQFRRTSTASLQEMYEKEGFRFLDMEYQKFTGKKELLWDATRRWIEADVWVWEIPFEITKVYPRVVDKYSHETYVVSCVEKLLRFLP